MSIKSNFLDEVKIGKNVELMIGAKEITGIVVSVDTESVKIKRESGNVSTVSLDMISFYEFGEAGELAEMEMAKNLEEAGQLLQGEAVARNERVDASAAAGEEASALFGPQNDTLLEKLAARRIFPGCLHQSHEFTERLPWKGKGMQGPLSCSPLPIAWIMLY